MMRFDLVVALRAEDGIPSKGPEALGLVFFLQIYQFARIAPPLLVFGVIVVFNESQRSALVLNQMSANRSKCRSSVMRTGEINLLVHCFESMRPSGHVSPNLLRMGSKSQVQEKSDDSADDGKRRRPRNVRVAVVARRNTTQPGGCLWPM
jgi:hypothetical protein